MFWKCTNLKSVKLGNAMKSIGGATFHECVSLSAIDLPESITWISNGYSGQFIGAGVPFYGCNDIVVTVKSGSTLTVDRLKTAGVKEENIHFE